MTDEIPELPTTKCEGCEKIALDPSHPECTYYCSMECMLRANEKRKM